MKINPSIKVSLVAVGFAALCGVAWWAFGEVSVGNFNPSPLVPGKVNLVAFKTGGNLRIRVANRIARLVEVGGDEKDQKSSSMDNEIGAKPIPIREFLLSLAGDEKALSKFVVNLNKLDEQGSIPIEAKRWPEADIQKALQGDALLQKQLETDLHMGLDGMPPDEIRLSAIRNGIVVVVDVPVKVIVNGQEQTLHATIEEPYRPMFAINLEKMLDTKFEPTTATIVGRYKEAAEPVLTGKTKPENVKGAIEELIGEKRKKALAAKPEQVLQGAQVLVTDSMFTSAGSRTYKDERERDLYDLQIGVTDDARKRLWKYSRNTHGFDLLLVVDGIAIAAPRITTELNGSTVTIAGLQEQSLVERTVQSIKEVSKKQ